MGKRMGHFIIKIIDVITGTITVIVGICIIGMITVGILFLFMPTTISSEEAKALLEERLDVELAGTPEVVYSEKSWHRDGSWDIMELTIPDGEDILAKSPTGLWRTCTQETKEQQDYILFVFSRYVPQEMAARAREAVEESASWYAIRWDERRVDYGLFDAEEGELLCLFLDVREEVQEMLKVLTPVPA